jgi:ABC-2 type transport system permease protein
MVLATCSFWFVRVDNILVIFQSMYEAGRWPVGIYPPALRWALTFLVPVAFAITVPAEALVGRLTGETLAGAVLLAIVLLIFSRRFWLIGLRHYTGASA